MEKLREESVKAYHASLVKLGVKITLEQATTAYLAEKGEYRKESVWTTRAIWRDLAKELPKKAKLPSNGLVLMQNGVPYLLPESRIATKGEIAGKPVFVSVCYTKAGNATEENITAPGNKIPGSK